MIDHPGENKISQSLNRSWDISCMKGFGECPFFSHLRRLNSPFLTRACRPKLSTFDPDTHLCGWTIGKSRRKSIETFNSSLLMCVTNCGDGSACHDLVSSEMLSDIIPIEIDFDLIGGVTYTAFSRMLASFFTYECQSISDMSMVHLRLLSRYLRPFRTISRWRVKNAKKTKNKSATTKQVKENKKFGI